MAKDGRLCETEPKQKIYTWLCCCSEKYSNNESYMVKKNNNTWKKYANLPIIVCVSYYGES